MIHASARIIIWELNGRLTPRWVRWCHLHCTRTNRGEGENAGTISYQDNMNTGKNTYGGEKLSLKEWERGRVILDDLSSKCCLCRQAGKESFLDFVNYHLPVKEISFTRSIIHSFKHEGDRCTMLCTCTVLKLLGDGGISTPLPIVVPG